VQTPDLIIFLHESCTIYRRSSRMDVRRPESPADVDVVIDRRWDGDNVGRGNHRPEWQDLLDSGCPTEALRVTERSSRPTVGHIDIDADRRSEGIHETVVGLVVVESSADTDLIRKHLRGEQQGRPAHGREVRQKLEAKPQRPRSHCGHQEDLLLPFAILGAWAALKMNPRP
jgi:hypothetical protein